jgi:hypothetical protein
MAVPQRQAGPNSEPGSSFRDWAGNISNFPREITETALAHVIGDKAEQAYRRSDALEKRRRLMEAWAAYCERTTGNVVQTSYASMTGRFSRLRHPADRMLWSFARSLGCEKDLSTLRSEGVPLCDAGATLTVRRPAAAKRIPLIRKAIRLHKQTIWPWCISWDLTAGKPEATLTTTRVPRPSVPVPFATIIQVPVRRTAVLFSKVAGACPDCLTPKG